MNYYNEFDPFAAAWLRKLIENKLIPDGDVDDRSITELRGSDLKGYTQCHFFAGIGGWSRALQLARWQKDRPVWTGSCPCQPFSSAITHGWLDDVYQDLESEGYACGSAVLPACSVGAPHKRDRLWFVASSEIGQNSRAEWAGRETYGISTTRNSLQPWGAGDECRNVANTESIRSGQRSTDAAGCIEGVDTWQKPVGFDNGASNVANAESGGWGLWQSKNIGKAGGEIDTPSNDCSSGSRKNSPSTMADTQRFGQQGQGQPTEPFSPAQDSLGQADWLDDVSTGMWESGIWIDCPDGKQRLVEPSIPLLAHGVSQRVGRLRGYGNAIVPQVAAEFIKAYVNS